jgi:hypothetical protein
MQEVKIITVREDREKFQSDINHALVNGWQLGQLSTVVDGRVVIYTMVMTKETAEVGAGSLNVGSVNRESLQFATKQTGDELAITQNPVRAQPQEVRTYSQWDDPGQSFYDK